MNKDNMEELKKEYDSIEVPPEIDLAIEKGIKKGKAHNKKRSKRPFTILAAGLVLVLGMASAWNFFSTREEALVVLESSKSLPSVGSEENFQKLLGAYIGQQGEAFTNGSIRAGAPTLETMPQDGAADKTSSYTGEAGATEESKASGSSTFDHSSTNIQVEGVDEEDLVKTDGEYIFKVNAGKIINIIKAEPASNMEAINNITFEDNYSINGIFLRENTLVVVGTNYKNVNSQKSGQNATYDMIMPAYGTTKVISFDITDKKNIVKVREVEVDGFYSSSRMIGSRIYVIANKYLNNISALKDNAEVGKVYYSDSSLGKEKIDIDYKEISYLPDAIQPNYIMIAAFNIDDNKEKVNVSTILGSGERIYSSDKNLYIAGTKWNVDKDNNRTTNTIVYKFAYENSGVKFVAKGEVPGTIVNQFSMDEKEDYFRIATTEFKYIAVMPIIDGNAAIESTDLPQKQITNNLYVLDKDMKSVGSLQGLANGEKIYSVRFIGDRAYMVTFMITDPLFVIDLKDPTSPKVLGELKIPGFSNYLHPYDDTHLIGFGMDTTVINDGGRDRAKTKGMKIAIFDVSNVAKPVQQFMTTIGGVGTYSEVLDNHKALLFSKEKNLLALPVTENNYDNNSNGSQGDYQGAYIYSIDLVNGIKLKGKITHLDEEKNTNKNDSTMTYFAFSGQYLVDRIMYIKDTLYTLSNGLIKASDINTLQEKSRLKLKTINLSQRYEDGAR